MFRLVQMPRSFFLFFFNDTATTEIYTLSLHDALPISSRRGRPGAEAQRRLAVRQEPTRAPHHDRYHGCAKDQHAELGERPAEFGQSDQTRSEEHTSELQSPDHLVCRLLLEKKKRQARHQSLGLRTLGSPPGSQAQPDACACDLVRAVHLSWGSQTVVDLRLRSPRARAVRCD